MIKEWKWRWIKEEDKVGEIKEIKKCKRMNEGNNEKSNRTT